MKFVCEHCNSKYNIADEKVRNKILKIRCKKCSKIIEVRDPVLKSAPQKKKEPAGAAGKPAPKKGASARGKPVGSALEDRFKASFKGGKLEAPDGKGPGTPGLFKAVKRSAQRMEKDEADLVVWFVAIDDKPVGPISAKGIFRHQRKRRVGDDSLVWKEGMPDWLRLRNCKELVGLLARLGLEAEDSGGEGKSEAPKERKSEPSLGLFGEDEKGEDQADSPLKGGSMGRLDERFDESEKSDGEGEEASDDAKDSGKGDPEKSFFVEQTSPRKEDLSEDFSTGMQSSVAHLKSIYPVKPSGGDRWLKFAAIGFFFVALVVLVVIILIPSSTPEQKVVEKVVEKIIEVEKEKIVYRDRSAQEGDEEVAEETGDKQARSKVKGGKKGKGKPEGESAEDKKRRLLAQMGMASGGVGDQKLVGATSGREDDDKAGASGGTALSQKQLSNVVNKNKGRLQICYEQSIKKGEAPEDRDVKVLLKLKVGPSGMVKSVTVGGSGARLAGLKSCLQRSVKKWVFPTSSGESAVEFPFLFTPK